MQINKKLNKALFHFIFSEYNETRSNYVHKNCEIFFVVNTICVIYIRYDDNAPERFVISLDLYRRLYALYDERGKQND